MTVSLLELQLVEALTRWVTKTDANRCTDYATNRETRFEVFDAVSNDVYNDCEDAAENVLRWETNKIIIELKANLSCK